ncbi:MAG: response regulator transcription factor [Chitinophagaceae bacterium]
MNTTHTSELSNHTHRTPGIALVDDHVLLRKGLCELIRGFDKYDILFEADNGMDFIKKLKPASLPLLVLMDINMREMDGYETTHWIKTNYPEIKVLALSMYDNETAIIRMFKAGAKGYILKDCDPLELKEALNAVIIKGFYYSEMVTGSLIHSINNLDEDDNHVKEIVKLNEREITFLKLVCTEYTYREIADHMCLSPRTIDGYRDILFQKLKVKTRVGLTMYAIKNGIETLD